MTLKELNRLHKDGERIRKQLNGYKHSKRTYRYNKPAVVRVSKMELLFSNI